LLEESEKKKTPRIEARDINNNSIDDPMNQNKTSLNEPLLRDKQDK